MKLLLIFFCGIWSVNVSAKLEVEKGFALRAGGYLDNMTFSHDSKTLAYVESTWRKEIKFVSVWSHKALDGEMSIDSSSFAISSDDKWLVMPAGDRMRTARFDCVWCPYGQSYPQNGELTMVAISRTDRYLVATKRVLIADADWSYFLTIVDFKADKILHEFPTENPHEVPLILPDEKSVVLFYQRPPPIGSKVLKSIEIESGKTRFEREFQNVDITAVAMASDGKLAIAYYQFKDGKDKEATYFLEIIDSLTGTTINSVELGKRSLVNSVAFSPNSQYLFFGIADQDPGKCFIGAYDLSKSSPHGSFEILDPGHYHWQIAISSDGQSLATNDGRQTLRILKLKGL